MVYIHTNIGCCTRTILCIRHNHYACRWLLSKCRRALRWRHNGHDNVSNHQPHHRLLNRLFRRRSKKTSKLRVTGLCVGNSPGTGEFPAQMASNAENVSIWWRHHGQLRSQFIELAEAETKWPPFRRHVQIHCVLQWKLLYLIRISLKYVSNGPIDNKPVLAQIMAWRRSGDKSLSDGLVWWRIYRPRRVKNRCRHWKRYYKCQSLHNWVKPVLPYRQTKTHNISRITYENITKV